MWRAYASLGGVYCLEFDGRRLVGCKFPPYEFGMRLKMTYGNEMPQPLQEVLDALGGFAGHGRFEAIAFGSLLSVLALKFKHPAFADKRKWRIVVQDRTPHI